MKAVIIAGGKGTRLRPLTYYIPKPMIPIFNKPLLLYQIELLKKYGITEIIINLHYLSDIVQTILGDGSQFGVKLFYSYEKEPLGTAGAVKNAENYFNEKETIIIFNGDILSDINIEKILNFHEKNKASLTITLTRVKDPTAFGLVFTDSENRITKFLEKPSYDEAVVDTINAGIYIINSKFLKYVPRGESYSFERGLFPLLLQLNEPVYGYIDDFYWIDVGNPTKYLQAHREMLLGYTNIDIPALECKKGNQYFCQNLDCESSVKFHGPLFIGKNVKIRKSVVINEFSVLGNDVFIDDRTLITRSIIGSGVRIGENVEISDCIIGNNCQIEDECKIGKNIVLSDNSILTKGTLLI